MTIAKVEHLLRLPSMRGHEARRGLTQAAHAICAGLGLRPVSVTFHGATSTASMNSYGDLRLADIDDDAKVSRAQFVRWVGFVVHELLHRKYTDFSKAWNRIEYVRKLHNAIEDAWIERTAIKSGLLGNVEGLLKTLVDGMVAESLTSVKEWESPTVYPWSLAVYARGFANKVPVPVDLLPIWQEASRRIDTCTSTGDCMAVAEWVFSQLILDEEQREEIEGEGDAPCDNPAPAPDGEPAQGEGGEGEGGEGEGGEGKGTPSEAADGEGAGGEGGEGDAADGEGGGKGGEEKAQQGTQKAAGGDKKGAVTPDQSGDVPLAGKSQRPHEYQDARKVEPTMRGSTAIEGSSGGTFNEAASVSNRPWLSESVLHNDVAAVSGKLKFEVRQLFENSGREDHQRNRRSGSVNVAALPSVATGNTRVFKRRVETAGVDSAVVLLLDISESMYSDRLIGTAVASTIALGEALTAAGVDVCVALFGETVCVMSPFGQPLKRKIDELRKVRDNRSTNDYFAVRYSHQLLTQHKAERKVLFVLTDGEGDRWTTANQVEIGERLGITTIGVGIQRDVSEVFKNNVRVNDIKALGTVAFSKIKLAA
jgi:hypothetical protein